MADIVSFDPTGFLPGGPKESMQMLADVINAAWNHADAKHTSFESKIGIAETELPDISDTVLGLDITAGTATGASVVEPTITIADANVTDVMAMFDTKYLELVALLADKFVLFRTTYFPDEQVAYTAAEDWLQAAVANPDAGIPLTVQEQVWEDDRSRILADADRASADVLAQFAAKRFPLPPGASAAATLQIQQKAQDEIAESSRKVAIASIEQMKFAVTSLLKLRDSAMSSAIDYIKALASGPDMASRLINVGYDAQSKMVSAASQFYNSRVAVAELSNKVSQFNVSSALEAAAKNQAADLELIRTKIEALLTESKSLAQMATSLYNNIHAQTSTGYSTSISDQV